MFIRPTGSFSMTGGGEVLLLSFRKKERACTLGPVAGVLTRASGLAWLGALLGAGSPVLLVGEGFFTSSLPVLCFLSVGVPILSSAGSAT